MHAHACMRRNDVVLPVEQVLDVNAQPPGISENLLGANAGPARRARLAILGNSFAAYAERWTAAGSVQVLGWGRFQRMLR